VDPNDLQSLLVKNLALIDGLCRFVARRSRMNDADVDDFCAWVRLKFIDDDYGVLRKFEGRCSLQTYLALVIRRLHIDYRGHLWGRFYASAEAQRLGPAAVALEELMHRDGRTLDESVAELRRRGVSVELEEARRMSERFPRRMKKQHVGLDDVPLIEERTTDDRVLARERGELAAQLSAALRIALAGLAPSDQTLLRLHFVAGSTVAEIARSMGADQQLLYRRIRALCRELRERLVGAGVDPARIRELLGDREIELGLADEKILRPSSSIPYSEGPGSHGGRDGS
jgi:RNA polymerase sigma factor (sigma-70 family)